MTTRTAQNIDPVQQKIVQINFVLERSSELLRECLDSVELQEEFASRGVSKRDLQELYEKTRSTSEAFYNCPQPF